MTKLPSLTTHLDILPPIEQWIANPPKLKQDVTTDIMVGTLELALQMSSPGNDITDAMNKSVSQAVEACFPYTGNHPDRSNPLKLWDKHVLLEGTSITQPPVHGENNQEKTYRLNFTPPESGKLNKRTLILYIVSPSNGKDNPTQETVHIIHYGTHHGRVVCKMLYTNGRPEIMTINDQRQSHIPFQAQRQMQRAMETIRLHTLGE